MRLHILRSLAAPLPDYREGDVRDVEDELADSLVKRGLAAATDDDLTPLDKKTGQRKGVDATPRVNPVDTDAPHGATLPEATDPTAGEAPKAAKAAKGHR